MPKFPQNNKSHNLALWIPFLVSGILTLTLFISSYSNTVRSVTTTSAATPTFLKARGTHLYYGDNKVILKGVNIDNVGALGPAIGTSPNIIDMSATEADYQKIAQYGGNHVRLGISYIWYRNNKSEFYAEIDRQLSYGQKHGIWVVLALFTTPGDCYEGYSKSCGIWQNANEKQALEQFWVEIASRYKDQVALAGYDLLNEPTPASSANNWDNSVWYTLAQKIRNSITAVDSNHLIFMEAAGGLQILKESDGTTKATNVVYETHFYRPMGVSHPGYGKGGTSIRYPGTYTDWFSGREYTMFFDKNALEGKTNSSVSLAGEAQVNWARQNDVPIYIGEWGMQGYSRDFVNSTANKDSLWAYVKDVADILSALEINHAHYTWEHDVFSAGGWRWGIFPYSRDVPDESQADMYRLSAVRVSFAGAYRPNFATGSGGANPSSSPAATVSPIISNPTPTTQAPSTNRTLKTNKNVITYSNGQRIMIRGVNIDLFRDMNYTLPTQRQLEKKDAIIAKMKSIGINAVRVNFATDKYSNILNENNGYQGKDNFTNFMEFCQSLVQNGIYVEPSMHIYTGAPIRNQSTRAYPFFKKIVEWARAKGFEDMLIMNPYNEPYSSADWADWQVQNKDTVSYLRNTLKFNGLIVLDTPVWAGSVDVGQMQQMVSYDNTVRGGEPRVAFANHYYPNWGFNGINSGVEASKTVPVMIGELGGDPGYRSEAVRIIRDIGVPNGHNGIFPWIWNWSDGYQMTDQEGDFVTLNAVGQFWLNEWYNKTLAQFPHSYNGTGLPSSSPVSSASPSPSPSIINSPTISPRPSISAQPTFSPVSSAIPSLSPPSPSLSPSDIPPQGGNVRTIRVYAAGNSGGGVYPNLEIKVNGAVVDSIVGVGSGRNPGIVSEYLVKGGSASNIQNIEIRYVNDDGAGRDVRVDKIIVDNVTYETESPTVYSEGSWSSTGCAGGYKKSEWLQCNGFFRYSISSNEVPISQTSIDVYAAGYSANNEKPNLALYVNNVYVTQFMQVGGDISKRSLVKYNYTYPGSNPVTKVKLQFTNDVNNRDVMIDKIVVNSQEYQSESPDVYSVGSWNAGNGCGAGFKKQEILHCNNAYFEYSIK